jgi:hypothetical protein
MVSSENSWIPKNQQTGGQAVNLRELVLCPETVVFLALVAAALLG